MRLFIHLFFFSFIITTTSTAHAAKKSPANDCVLALKNSYEDRQVIHIPENVRMGPSRFARIEVSPPQVILDRIQANLDHDLKIVEKQNYDMFIRMYVKNRVRHYNLGLDFVSRFSFYIEAFYPTLMDIPHSGYRGYSEVATAKHAVKYLRGFDGTLYIRVKLEAYIQRSPDVDFTKIYRIGYATVEAKIDPVTGNYSDVQVVESKVVRYGTSRNFPF